MSLFQYSSYGNTAGAAIQLIRALKIPVTKSTVEETVESHPDYPSILSITDNLKRWKVNNATIHVATEHFGELPLPFIAHAINDGDRFMLVTNVNGAIEYMNEYGSRFELSRDNFLKQWPDNGEVKMQGGKPEAMDGWCKAIGIPFTPTLF